MLGGSRYSTIETEIWYQTNSLLNLSAAAALSIVQVVFVVAALSIANQFRKKGEAALVMSKTASTRSVCRSVLGAILVTVFAVLGLIITPMASLISRSVFGANGFSLANYRRLFEVGGTVFGGTVIEAAGRSLLIAAVATLISLTLGSMISFVISRKPASKLGAKTLGIFDQVFMLPLGVSAVTIGFGFLITMNKEPLNLLRSWWLIPLAQATVALPLVLRTLLPIWRAINPRLREAAATLGAPPARVLATIDLPYLFKGIGLATGLAFATSLGEFGATSFLARPNAPTLPVVIFRLISRPGSENFSTAVAAAVFLALLTAIAIILAELIGGGEEVRQ
jgi:thiamine transport system permease protein